MRLKRLKIGPQPAQWVHLLMKNAASALLIVSTGVLAAGSQKITVSVEATVVKEPCSIRPGDETLLLDFGPISLSGLLAEQQTQNLPFQIHLENCTRDTFKGVRVTFEGMPANELPDYLAISANSEAKGLAIGLVDANQQPLPINKPSSLIKLSKGDVGLQFYTHIRALPSAVKQQKITPGEFNAQATFRIDYE